MNTRDLMIHAGVAGLLAAGVATAAMTVSTLADSGGGTQSVYVPIAPCRLADTRPAPDNVGTRNTPLAQTEIQTFQVWGTNGNCTIPTTATGIGTNVTAVNPTADGYLTVYPADVERPLASNLNWTRTSPPTPNQVTVGLSATGAIAAYNNGGTIDVIIDIVGYYQALPASGTGPQGPAGPTGPQGATGATGPAGPPNRISNSQIALLRWDQDPGRPATYPTGDGPRGIAYDGTYIWVANYDGNSVSRINPATGARNDFPSGTGISNPHGIAYDGTSIWVTNYSSNNVSKINPATGAKQDYPTGTGASHPYGIAYDGTSIWVTNYGSNTVSKINPATGDKHDYPTGTGTSGPRGIVYDGTNIWVANSGGNHLLSKINPATGDKHDEGIGSSEGSGLAFDGTNIWVTDYGDASVKKYNPGAAAYSYTSLSLPLGIAFDGTNMWVANNATLLVSKFNAASGDRIDYRAGGDNPYGIAFDGTNIWVTNQGSDTVSKINPG